MIQVLMYTPSGTRYDLTADSEYKVFDAATPDMEWGLEDGQGRITDGMLSMTADNSTGWWDSHLSITPGARFSEESWASSGAPGVFFVRLLKNGTVRWEGDITDPVQVQRDGGDDAKTVSFTVMGKLSRLNQWNAGHVKRDLPAPFTGATSTRLSKPKVIALPLATASYPIEVGDEFLLQKFAPHGAVSNLKAEVVATRAQDGTLGANEVRFKQRLKFDVTSNASVYCSTPYHHGKTALELCQLLLDHAEVPRAKQFLDPALAAIVVPYADFKDKGVGDALVEIAACAPASVWGDVDGYHVVRLDTSMAAGASPKNLDPILMRPVVTDLWGNYHSSVTVTGSDERKVRRGRLTYPDTTLDVSTDFMDKTADLGALCLRLWQFYGFERKAADAEVADDGTVYRFWQDVTAGGTAYKVVGIREPALSVDADCLSTVQLTLWECGASDLSALDADDDPEADDTDPPPEPLVEAVTKEYDTYPAIRVLYEQKEWPGIKKVKTLAGTFLGQPLYTVQRFRLWVVVLTWEGDLTKLVDFLVSRWPQNLDRDKGKIKDNFPYPDPYADGKYYLPIYVLCGNKRQVDVQAIYYNGDMSAETDGYVTGYPAAVDDEGEGDDEQPAAATLTSIASYVDDVPGTPGKEASVDVVVGLAANTPKKHVHAYLLNKDNGKHYHSRALVHDADASATIHFERICKKGKRLLLLRLEVTNDGLSAHAPVDANGFPTEFADASPYAFVAGGGAVTPPLAPTIASATHTKLQTLVSVTLPNDTSGAVLQLFAAPTGTASNPDSAPGAWGKVHHTEITDDIAAGRLSVPVTVNRPNLYRKAMIARIRSVYDHTVFSPWSAIYDAGTPPSSEDTPPPSVAVSLQSPLDDVPGTTRKEASLGVTFALASAGADRVKAVFQDAATGRRFTAESACSTTDTSVAVWIEKKLAAGHTLNTIKARAWNGTAYTDAGYLPSIVAGSNTVSGGAPSAPAAPTIAIVSGSVGPHHAEFDIGWASSPYIRSLRLKKYQDGGYKDCEPVDLTNAVKSGLTGIRVKVHFKYAISGGTVPYVMAYLRDCYDQESGYNYAGNSGTLPSPLVFYQNSNGQLNVGNLEVTANNTTENLQAKFAGDGTHVYLKGDWVWPRAAIAVGALPASGLGSGLILPVFNSANLNEKRFCLYAYFPKSLTGLTLNKWGIFKAEATSGAGEVSDPVDVTTPVDASGTAGGGCFAAGTLVLMDDYSMKRIEDVRPLDSILTLDQMTGEPVASPVFDVQHHDELGPLPMVRLNGVPVTTDHLFCLETGAAPVNAPWTPARSGMTYKGAVLEGEVLSPSAVVADETPGAGEYVGHNMTTHQHTYLVSADGVSWILAHNSKALP